MKRTMTAVAVVIAATTLVAGCHNTGSHRSAGRPADDQGGVTQTAGSGPAGSPATASSGRPNSDGTVQVTFRGTQGSPNVNCSDINTEFLLSPATGTIKWNATPHDSDNIYDPQIRAMLPDVTVDPASGLLGPGQSTVIHVRGHVAAPAKEFWIWVVAPNRGGTGGIAVELACRG